MTLQEYVRDHTNRGQCTCGRCIDSGEPTLPEGELRSIDDDWIEHTADVFFFDVSAKNSPKEEEFRKLIEQHKGEFGDSTPLDGNEHSYMELGGWIGDQGLALQFMGLGVILGVFDIMHPVNMLKMDRQNPMAQQLAGMGMITVTAKKAK